LFRSSHRSPLTAHAIDVAEEIADAEKEFGCSLMLAERRLMGTMVKIQELKEQNDAAGIGFCELERRRGLSAGSAIGARGSHGVC